MSSNMNVVILDDYQGAVNALDCFRLLDPFRVTVLRDPARSIDDLAERLREADALVLIRERTRITRELLRRLPRLKLISQTGKVSQHLDLDACTEAGVAVAEGVGSPIAPAELAWALILAARRKLCAAVNDARDGKWQTNLGRALHGDTLGIWGYGRIGKLVANCGKAFGMRVLVWGGEASRDGARDDGFDAAASREEFFAIADVVTLHLRLTPQTNRVVRLDDLQRMKPDALFVNTSRAELVEQGALERALAGGRPGFAALDVYEQEPIYDAAYPLFRLPNVLCTPHLGYVERNSYELYFNAAFRNVVAYAGGQPANIANPSVLSVTSR